MSDFQSRQIIEALRSGISSLDVGEYFSSARPAVLSEIQSALDAASETHTAGGRIITGKYGEGKSHLLNTVFAMAHRQNMVVSKVTLSKETPMSGIARLYPKILQGTYLPGQVQPGIADVFEGLSANMQEVSSLLEYCLTQLEVNKLYYVLKSYFGTQDEEEKFLLRGDIEGDFMAPAAIRKIYRRIFNEPAVKGSNFVKSKHIPDYIAFLARLFEGRGYGGWVILFDEAELIGRLGRKSRHAAYLNMDMFLHPGKASGVYSIFVFNASFAPDVIEAKHEYENLDNNVSLFEGQRPRIEAILSEIATAHQLAPLNRGEVREIMEKIREHHASSYDWQPQIDAERLTLATEKHGYLLRTRIRAAVEILDQLYQYGEAGDIRSGALEQLTFEEDEDVDLESFLQD
ncbi:MAG: ATP-binding protein [Clostridiales Family XIII bacterium]|jgi:hypothetical protein|nr:ATP-binding protein [Clostridiales Family XIII bacterium]